MPTDEACCVVCGGKVQACSDYDEVWGTGHSVDSGHGYYCTVCKLRYSDLPPKSYGLADKIKIVEEP